MECFSAFSFFLFAKTQCFVLFCALSHLTHPMYMYLFRITTTYLNEMTAC